MAKLIVTGQHEAIQLKELHGEQVLQLDKALVELKLHNGGWGRWWVEIRGGALEYIETFIKAQNTMMNVSLKPKRRKLTA